MFNRIESLCPTCGNGRAILHLVHEADENVSGIPIGAICLSCGLRRVSFVSYEVLHFVLRVFTKDHPNQVIKTKPYRWRPLKPRQHFNSCWMLLMRKRVRVAVNDLLLSEDAYWKFAGIIVFPEVVSSHWSELAEHRVTRSLIRAILCSSGDRIDEARYSFCSLGSVRQPLAS